MADILNPDTVNPFDRAASWPSPLFDFTTGFVPRKLKDLLKMSEYLYYNCGQVTSVFTKFGQLAVTEIEYNTENEQLKKNYKKLFEKHLHVKTLLLQQSLDINLYGNFFASIYHPFIRYLVCDKCKQPTNIESLSTYVFKLADVSFRYTCPCCNKETMGTVSDKHIIIDRQLHIIRWDPKSIDIEYNPFTGSSRYYLNIPTDWQDRIKNGVKEFLNSTPMEFIIAIQQKKLFKFEPGRIFHAKTPAPSGIDQAWGFPTLASTLKPHLHAQILRKANEAIALEHIVPLRVLHPVQNGSVDFAQAVSLENWQQQISQGIRMHRRDPNHMIFAPIPVGVTNIGGDGRSMLTLAEVQEAEKVILATLGVPAEFIYGGLTKAGMEATLRIIENQLQSHSDDLNGFLQWITDNTARYTGWEPIETSLVPLKLVDDTESKTLLLKLVTGELGGAIVAPTTIMERLGLDPEAERVKRKQFALDELRLKNEIDAETMKLNNTLSQQVQAQLQGQQGLQYSPQEVMKKADEVAQQLVGLDDGMRKSQLHQLQVSDYVMYSVVVQRLEEIDTTQRAQVKQQMQQMQQQGQV